MILHWKGKFQVNLLFSVRWWIDWVGIYAFVDSPTRAASSEYRITTKNARFIVKKR